MKKVLFLLSLVLISFVVFCSELRVYFLDVGQGDSTFVITPKNKTILIDGGDANEYYDYGKDVFNFITKLGYNKVDMVFLTHPHRDHVGGLVYIMENMDVGKFYDTGFSYPTQVYQEVLEIVKEKNIKYILGRKKSKVYIEPELEVSILYPPEILYFDDPNNNSMVVRIKYRNVSILVTGDIERNAEKEIVKKYERNVGQIESNILKVPHHGSDTSSSLEFLSLVKPEVAVISCGRNNRFGFPKSNVLRRYERLGVEIYRTDLDGTVEITTDGEDYKVKIYGK